MKELIIEELLRSKVVTIPLILLKTYQKMGLSEKELIFLSYLLNSNSDSFDPESISEDLGLEISEVLSLIGSLDDLGMLKLIVKEDSNIHTEKISLDRYYQKLKLLLISSTNEVTTVFDEIEKEFARTITPIEYEIINKWKENGYSDEIILLALKEAVINNARSIKYIDKILYEWDKQNIKTNLDYEKVKSNREQKEKLELFEYDWLNE